MGEYPELVDVSPGWGAYEGCSDEADRLQIENQIFWGASALGLNGFDLLEEYKRRPDRVLGIMRMGEGHVGADPNTSRLMVRHTGGEGSFVHRVGALGAGNDITIRECTLAQAKELARALPG